MEQIQHEMEIIAQSGMEEILILTGESRAQSDVAYIGEACKLARKYFRMVGLEIYPVNTEEYRYLHQCGADYVTVFQETYDTDKYERAPPPRPQTGVALPLRCPGAGPAGGMRGWPFRPPRPPTSGRTPWPRGCTPTSSSGSTRRRRSPLSCPRLRPIVNNDKINPWTWGEELCQVLCAYRLFLPFAGDHRLLPGERPVPGRHREDRRHQGLRRGFHRHRDHEEKYTGKSTGAQQGDEQFEIADGRSFAQMYHDMDGEGLQPVLNDYLYV